MAYVLSSCNPKRQVVSREQTPVVISSTLANNPAQNIEMHACCRMQPQLLAQQRLQTGGRYTGTQHARHQELLHPV